jgi:hypothetical protein
MNNRLPNDYCRCYGYLCPQKEECKRYLTIAVDSVWDEKNGPSVRSYVSSMQSSGSTEIVADEDCYGFIQAEGNL